MKEKELIKVLKSLIDASSIIAVVKDSCAYQSHKDQEITLNYADILLRRVIESLSDKV